MKTWIIAILPMMFFIIYSVVVYAEDINIPKDAVEFNKHYYKLYDFHMTWEEAQTYCESIGGHLATITSLEENEFLFKYITSLNCSSAYFGATDKENEGNWKWVTDEEFIFSNWHNGEPNNEGENENYGMFYYKFDDGTWNDGGILTENASVNETLYICEWDSKRYEYKTENKQQNTTIIYNDTTQITESKNDNNNINNATKQQNEIKITTETEETDNGINITFHIDNISIIGGLSIFGGISFIGFMIKRKNNKE